MTDSQVLYLVRHGETDANVEHRFAGWSDDPLNERGRGQVGSLAGRFIDRGVERVYASPVRRAAETAGILGKQLSAPIQTVNDLREIELGAWQGHTMREVARLFPAEHEMWADAPDALAVEGRETLADLETRSIAAIDIIGRAAMAEAEGPVLAVTHLAVIRVLLLAAAGRPLSDYHDIRIPNAEAHPIRWTGPGRFSPGGDPIRPGLETTV